MGQNYWMVSCTLFVPLIVSYGYLKKSKSWLVCLAALYFSFMASAVGFGLKESQLFIGPHLSAYTKMEGLSALFFMCLPLFWTPTEIVVKWFVSLLTIFSVIGKPVVINVTMDACLIALFFPLLNRAFKLIAIAALIKAWSVTAFATLLLHISPWFIALAPLPIIFAESGGRYEFWKMCLNKVTIKGWGAGTFALNSATMQTAQKFTDWGIYVWAHNDFLQILMEYGVIGAAFAVLLWARTMNFVVLPMLLLQMPLRHPASIMLLGFLFFNGNSCLKRRL